MSCTHSEFSEIKCLRCPNPGCNIEWKKCASCDAAVIEGGCPDQAHVRSLTEKVQSMNSERSRN